jgi:hypothetical protein
MIPAEFKTCREAKNWWKEPEAFLHAYLLELERHNCATSV